MSLSQLHKELLQQWANESSRKTDAIAKAVAAIKVLLADGATVSSLDHAALVTIHRDVLEIDALSAALQGNLKAFDDAISQVMIFYTSLHDESSNKFLMMGLNLMFLLASNRLSDFHVLLEQITQSVQTSNPYISTPVKLEQSLMEGAYNKIVLTEKTIPSPFYAAFIRIMMDTVRNEIASCVEKSFARLPVKDAQSFLLFEQPAELSAFAAKRGWKLEGSTFSFETPEAMQTDDRSTAPKTVLDTQRIAKQTIFYAKQLEMIV